MKVIHNLSTSKMPAFNKKGKHIIAFFILLVSFHCTNAQAYSVNLVPIEEVSKVHISLVKSFIQDYYNAKVYIQDPIEVKQEFITKFDTILDATAINQYLAEHANSSDQKWIGVTDWAITIGNVMPMVVRGHTTEIGGNSAVVFSYKVLAEAHAHANYTFHELLSKVAKHEFGHVLGLEHCTYDEHCLMTFGTYFLEANDELCERCKDKIGFNSLKRH